MCALEIEKNSIKIVLFKSRDGSKRIDHKRHAILINNSKVNYVAHSIKGPIDVLLEYVTRGFILVKIVLRITITAQTADFS